MAFHRVGNSIYSDEELRSRNEEIVTIVIPLVLAAGGVYYLYGILSVTAFFIVHTTTAKLLYVVTGITLFCVGYVFRKLIITMIVLAVMLAILGITGFAFFEWLLH